MTEKPEVSLFFPVYCDELTVRRVTEKSLQALEEVASRFEVLIIDDLVKDLILQRASAHEIAGAAVEAGDYNTLKENAAEKVIQGITSLEEAASAVMV